MAIILAAGQQRRQMVQRMGRILRRKADGRVARFAIAYVKGTNEDPSRGAHEVLLSEVLDVADKIECFSVRADGDKVRAYLSPR